MLVDLAYNRCYTVARSGKGTLGWLLTVGILAVGVYMVRRDPEGVVNRLRDVWEAVVALFPGRG